jgi:hypothetical protein
VGSAAMLAKTLLTLAVWSQSKQTAGNGNHEALS